MVKLTKQDKIEIFHLWQDYGIGPKELSHRYRVNRSTINYLLALIKRYGTAVLDRPYTSYSADFKVQAIRQVLIKGKTAHQVSLDLGLKGFGMLANWIRNYRKNGYNVVINQKGRLPHDQKRTANQAGKSPLETRKRTLTPAEFEADRRERIRKKLRALVNQRTKNRKPRK